MKKLLFIAGLIALISLIAKKAQADREQWSGLTEEDVRDRLDRRLPHRIPDDRRQVIADSIVTKMRDRGALQDEDTIDLAGTDEAIENAAEAEETASA